MVLKLKKVLYGLSQSPGTLGRFLQDRLESVGLKQAEDVDACLFVSPKVICITYVDDTLFFARNMSNIDEVIEKLRHQEKMTLEVELDAAGFLGVSLKHDEKAGTVILRQTGLIDRILEALGVEDLPGVDTPANRVLGKDKLGDPPECNFKYASIIGMLWYL